jgi:hypothetical protein
MMCGNLRVLYRPFSFIGLRLRFPLHGGPHMLSNRCWYQCLRPRMSRSWWQRYVQVDCTVHSFFLYFCLHWLLSCFACPLFLFLLITDLFGGHECNFVLILDLGLDYCTTLDNRCTDDSDCPAFPCGTPGSCPGHICGKNGQCVVVESCGSVMCGEGEYCCNRSCSIWYVVVFAVFCVYNE